MELVGIGGGYAGYDFGGVSLEEGFNGDWSWGVKGLELELRDVLGIGVYYG